MREMLIELGWSQAELGRRLSVSANTVSNWSGDAPGYAMAYLGVCLKLSRLATEVL